MKINKPEIFKRLLIRLGLEPGVIAPEMSLLPVATLVTDLCKLLTDPKFIYLPSTDPEGDGWYTLYTVPAGKRARLYAASYERVFGTGLIFSHISVAHKPDERISLIMQAAASSIKWLCAHPMPVAENWIVQLLRSGYVAGDKVQGGLWIEEEDL